MPIGTTVNSRNCHAREVAQFWRENYDLRHILERDRASLGPQLEGKLFVYAGDMDSYYLSY